MKEASQADLQRALESTHGCRATFREVVRVKEDFQGRAVWDGLVHIFTLDGHPSAQIGYAWSSPIEGTERRRFYAVLHQDPVTSAASAVRAAIIQDYREANNG